MLKVKSLRHAQSLKGTALGKVLDAFHYPATLTNSKDRFVYVNKAFTARYGFSEKEILGLSPTILVPRDFPAGELKALKKHIATRQNGWEGPLINQTKLFEPILIYLRTAPIRPSKHLPTLLYLGFSASPEEIKDAETELFSLFAGALLLDGLELTKLSKKKVERSRQYEVCRLHKLGYSTKEIASIMGITVSTVNVVTWRARQSPSKANPSTNTLIH